MTTENHLPPVYHACFRFYAELNDFLPREKRMVCFLHQFERPAPVKDIVEALGVPHPEIDLILANGESVDFAYLVQDGDRISVYPVFESFDITPLLRVRPQPLRQARFVLDTHLGRLAAYLRLMGFDALYRNDYTDPELADISGGEKRILLTRDRSLLKRNQITHGYCVRATEPRQQLMEVLRRFDLFSAIQPFQRCLHCNGSLRTVSRDAIKDQIPPAAAHYTQYTMCTACGKIYWPGSHFRRLQKLIKAVEDDAAHTQET